MATKKLEVNTLRVGEENIVTVGSTCIVFDKFGNLAGVARGEQRFSLLGDTPGWEQKDAADLQDELTKFLVAEVSDLAASLLRGSDDGDVTEGL